MAHVRERSSRSASRTASRTASLSAAAFGSSHNSDMANLMGVQVFAGAEVRSNGYCLQHQRLARLHPSFVPFFYGPFACQSITVVSP